VFRGIKELVLWAIGYPTGGNKYPDRKYPKEYRRVRWLYARYAFEGAARGLVDFIWDGLWERPHD
jgi:hypothetical protein